MNLAAQIWRGHAGPKLCEVDMHGSFSSYSLAVCGIFSFCILSLADGGTAHEGQASIGKPGPTVETSKIGQDQPRPSDPEICASQSSEEFTRQVVHMVDYVTAKLRDLRSGVRDKQIREMGETITGLNNTLAKREREYGLLDAQLSDLSRKLASRETKCGELSATIYALKKRVEDLTAEIDEGKKKEVRMAIDTWGKFEKLLDITADWSKLGFGNDLLLGKSETIFEIRRVVPAWYAAEKMNEYCNKANRGSEGARTRALKTLLVYCNDLVGLSKKGEKQAFLVRNYWDSPLLAVDGFSSQPLSDWEGKALDFGHFYYDYDKSRMDSWATSKWFHLYGKTIDEAKEYHWLAPKDVDSTVRLHIHGSSTRQTNK